MRADGRISALDSWIDDHSHKSILSKKKYWWISKTPDYKSVEDKRCE